MTCTLQDSPRLRQLALVVAHGAEVSGTREAQAAGDARHDRRDEVVEVAKGWSGELQGAETDVIQRLIVENHALVRILHQLMH